MPLNCVHHIQWVRPIAGGLHQCILCLQAVTRKDVYPKLEDLPAEVRARWDAHEATAPKEPPPPAKEGAAPAAAAAREGAAPAAAAAKEGAAPAAAAAKESAAPAAPAAKEGAPKPAPEGPPPPKP